MKKSLHYFTHNLNNKGNNGKYDIYDILVMYNTIIYTRINDIRIYKDKMLTSRSNRDGIYYIKNQPYII